MKASFHSTRFVGFPYRRCVTFILTPYVNDIPASVWRRLLARTSASGICSNIPLGSDHWRWKGLWNIEQLDGKVSVTRNRWIAWYFPTAAICVIAGWFFEYLPRCWIESVEWLQCGLLFYEILLACNCNESRFLDMAACTYLEISIVVIFQLSQWVWD